MPVLTLRFLKKPDGVNVLTCQRDDGTATWQHQRGDFFVHHDLTHYAIETTLGLQHAFYGLVARGWDFTDFGTPWPRGPFPPESVPEAGLTEGLAGAFDLERINGLTVRADAINTQLREAFVAEGIVFDRTITEAELDAIRATFQRSITLWYALPPGEAMELTFALSP
jgi:hypothetical protein